MKHLIRIVLALILAGLFVVALSWSGTDISKSTNYKTYELKYLANLSGVAAEKKDSVMNDLKKALDLRLHEFDVASVSIEKETTDNNEYLNIKFGTIDDIKEIKTKLENNETFLMKEKVKIETPVEEPKEEVTTTDTIETAKPEEAAETTVDATADTTAETETPAPVEPYKAEIEERANATLQKILAGETFEIVAQNEVITDPARIVFAQANWMYKDEIKPVFADILFNMEPGSYKELIKFQERPFVLAPPIDIIAILKLNGKQEVDRTTSTTKQVEVSHILVAYKGATRAAETIKRTKEEAKSLADEIKSRLGAGEDFAALAKQYSDDPSNKDTGGALQAPAGANTYVPEFEQGALTLEKEGDISTVVETPFGYHIIKANKVVAATETTNKDTQVRFSVLFYALQQAEWTNTELNKDYIASVETLYSKEYDPYILVTFNDAGKTMLKDLTARNLNNILGIFAGKELITSFTVQEVNDKGTLTILRPANTKDADELKAKLLQKALPAPIILMEEKENK